MIAHSRCWSLKTWGVSLMLAGACLGGAGATPELRSSAGDELFTNSAIRHLRLEIGDAEMAILRKPVAVNRDTEERPAVPATVWEGGLVWTNVAVHLKGSFGSFRRVDDKPALTLNFAKLAEGQRFHGLQKISLNNSVQDRSYLNEKITREIYVAAGVPTPRTDFATVELNGRALGLYVLAEGWNKQFLRRYFVNTKGNFYDLHSSRDVNQPREASFGQDPNNHAALLALREAVNEPDPARRLARLRETLDLDRFVTLHALDVLMWNWDGYALNRNNYRMFHDLEKNRLVFFPHGLDQMFGKTNGPIMTGRSGRIAKALLETAEGRRLYLDRLTQLRSTIFDVHAITNRIAELAARLRPASIKQGLLLFALQQQAADHLRGLIVARAYDVDAQLASVKNFRPLELNAARRLTNWTMGRAAKGIAYNQTTDTPPVLELRVTDGSTLGAWTTKLWLEEGRYRVEGRVKTREVQSAAGDEGGAGFRVWSDRKETRGSSWGWLPHTKSRDGRQGGILPVVTNTPLQRLQGDKDWTNVSYEFELRQPLADLEIQCVLQASTGTAWFDLSSLNIVRLSFEVSRSTARAD